MYFEAATQGTASQGETNEFTLQQLLSVSLSGHVLTYKTDRTSGFSFFFLFLLISS